jgi:hypothetical protein
LEKSDFDRILFEAVDEGLSSLGDSSKQAIYFHLEKGFNIKKREIPERIGDFDSAIQRIFGLGANFLEILIMKRLYEKVDETFEWHEPDNFAFSEYVEEARRVFQKRKEIKMTEELIECEEAIKI